MVTKLYIKNFALIEELELDFYEGFTAISGETGSGKSIIQDAIYLLLGARADNLLFFDDKKKIVIEASFSDSRAEISEILEENEIEVDDELILRREISAQGKSRSYVNDTLVNLSILKEIGTQIIDIQTQLQSSELLNKKFQYQLLDSYSKTESDLNLYRTKLEEYKKNLKRLNELKEKQKTITAENEFNQYQHDELEKAKIDIEEHTTLEAKIEILENSELILNKLSSVSQFLSSDEVNIINSLNEVKKNLFSIAKFSQEYKDLAERIESTIIELKDIDLEVTNKVQQIDLSKEELELTQERLSLYNTLMIKHQSKDIQDLLSTKAFYKSKLTEVESLEVEINNLEKKVESTHEELSRLAENLSNRRIENAEQLSIKIEEVLKKLLIPFAKINFKIDPDHDFNNFGKDKLTIKFSANKGIEPENLEKVVSGGELSRLLLASKYILAKNFNLPTLFFDEIDSGISGEVAIQMGKILREMSESVQIISISHQPQVIAAANKHLKVSKNSTQEKTISTIKYIEGQERINEITELLFGKNQSDSAKDNAKELLNIFGN